MKRLLSSLIGLVAVCSLAFAQGANAFGEGLAEKNSVYFGDYFEVSGLSYIGVGLSIPHNLGGSSDFTDHTNMFRNNEFFFNVVELQARPFDGGVISLGADLSWEYYRLKKSHYWSAELNNTKADVHEIGVDIKSVRKSQLSVMTFSFPLSFEYNLGSFSFRAGAAAELNLNGIVRFRGEGMDGSNISENTSGKRYSNHISTNLFTYSLFASASYGGLGVYTRFRPTAQFAPGYGPCVNTFTVGIVMGLGM